MASVTQKITIIEDDGRQLDLVWADSTLTVVASSAGAFAVPPDIQAQVLAALQALVGP